MSIRNLKVTDNLNVPAEEAYRVLRTNIQFCTLDNKLKTIAVTSCNPGEGKTTTAVNLAITIAKYGTRILLVDADLRKPMAIKGISPEDNVGLSNYLTGMASFDQIIRETNIPNLFTVFCGVKPPNPSELLGTQRFKDFMKECGEKYDMVIIDTPPLGSVIDCAVISTLVDGVILVIRRKKVDIDKALHVKMQLEKVNARILGVVLNKIIKSDYKNYYTYYNYSSMSLKKHRLTRAERKKGRNIVA